MAHAHRVALLLDGARGWDAGLLRGIADYVNLHRPWEILRPAATHYQRFAGLHEMSLAALLKQRLTGVIMHQSPLTSRLWRSGIPVIAVPIKHPDSEDEYYITCDNQGAGAVAARHLIGLGLKQFAYVGFERVFWSQHRLAAYRDYLHERGHRLHTHLVPLVPTDANRPKLHRALTRWLRQLPKPIGVFVGNDDLARAVAELCRLNDIDIPDEVALLACDNDELICDLNNPTLSSIPFGTEQAGYAAAETLACLMERKTPKSSRIEASALPVVVRRSTDRLAIEDTEVLRALRFIRDHRSLRTHVSDVADATALSQRTLHNRFKAALGHSVAKEMNHQRAQYVATLLVETNQSISEIAWKLGYSEDAHLVRFFRGEMGETPAAYRRRASATKRNRD